MTKLPLFGRCSIAAADFPAIPTALAVASCLAQALIQKYFPPTRLIQIALALGQAVPAGLLLRYLLARSSKPNREIDDQLASGIARRMRLVSVGADGGFASDRE